MQCPECRMNYVPDLPEDEKTHKAYHDKIVNGLYAPLTKSDKVVWDKDDYRITVVNYRSPLVQKKRAEKVGRGANKDTPFDFSPYHSSEYLDERNVHIFLLYGGNRAIGFLKVELMDCVRRFTWEEYKNATDRELSEGKPIWSIGLVWIHCKHRGRGLGSQLVQVAASYLDVETQSIGWQTPFTDDGKMLVKSICPESFFIAQ